MPIFVQLVASKRPVWLHIIGEFASMLGQRIEKEIQNQRLSITEFAKRIKRSRSFAYKVIESDSLETGDLLNISKVLRYNFFAEYNESLKHLPPFEEELTPEQLADRLRYIENENQNLKRIIALLEEKLQG